jgi:thiol-disulfide isomerase/thioredoxin
MMGRAVASALMVSIALAQNPSPPPTPEQLEQQELVQGLSDANSSAVDILRFLEGFIKKHPQVGQRPDVINVLARAAIESKDDIKTVLYGKRALEAAPDDLLLLDRVARALLALPGSEKERRDNALLSLTYSMKFAGKFGTAPPPDGKEVARKLDERDRALARATLYQSRAMTVLGDKDKAEQTAARAFAAYPSEETAREWSDALGSLGRAAEAIERLADAFEIPDTHATDADRVTDRKRLGEQYRKLHGSEKGLGDLMLAAYDRTASVMEERRARLRGIDPNMAETEPMRFTLKGLDGKKLTLESLKGNVVILDFWATWCVPCRAQHPLYEEVKQRFKDRGNVMLLSIDTDEDQTLVAPFLDQQKWPRDSVYFDDGLQRLLQVTSIPTTILFDKQGRIASRMVGFLPDKFADQLSERIQSALQQ